MAGLTGRKDAREQDGRDIMQRCIIPHCHYVKSSVAVSSSVAVVRAVGGEASVGE